ncbi:hypothetical protein [Nocardia altamirensis]|uniref:hypothetical protein n=1 Tax=Nocardia altamirensis TaxID=472158 RepID=UPI0008407CF6|nr:hypothetical protein [Nocardia altamirensis]
MVVQTAAGTALRCPPAFATTGERTVHDATETTDALPCSSADAVTELYTWEIAHDGAIVESGAAQLGEPHPLTGSTAGHHYEIACGLFEQACERVVDEHRYEVMMARVEGEPEPRAVSVVTVVLRYPDNAVAVSMTANPRHRPITEKDMREYREYLEWAEEDHRRYLERKALNDEALDLPWETTEVEWAPEDVIDRADPRLARIIELEDEAADVRDEVFDPEHCRARQFRAEQKLHEARAAAANGDGTAAEEITRRAERVARWTNLLAETTAAYLQAAALDAEAARLRRVLQAEVQAEVQAVRD